MPRILAFGPETPDIGRALKSSGHTVVSIEIDRSGADVAKLYEAFSGRPPEALVANLSRSSDFRPVTHMVGLIREIWGERMPTPPCLALVTRNHFSAPELTSVVDDIMSPPYEASEAVIRINLLLFRLRRIRNNKLLCAELTLDLDGGLAYDAEGRQLPLTPREFGLLAFLCSHPGKFFSREHLLNLVWGVQFGGSKRTVDIHVRRLRAKLPMNAADLLETRRGTGYGLADPR